MKTAGVLLAAGASRRFGAADKLLAPLNGRPLISYAARALVAAKPDVLIAISRNADVDTMLAGFDIMKPPENDPKQSDSLRAGIARAQALGARRSIVVLGDMPFVTPGLIENVMSRSTPTTPAAATDGQRRMPPACFPAACFADLLAQTGDRGAAAVLQALPQSALVTAEHGELLDIDTPDALAAAQAQLA